MKRSALLLIFLLPGLLFSQIRLLNKTGAGLTCITGTVTDRSTGEAVIGAMVYLDGTGKGGATDINGFFSFKCNPGSYTLRVHALSYFTDSLRLNIDSGYLYNFRCDLRDMIADSATINPATGNIYGLAFTKKGAIDSAHSSFSSLDSIVEMMKEKPMKKITLLVGYRYEDGSFEPLNDDEFFIRTYLTSHGILNDRIPFGNVASTPQTQPGVIYIVPVQDVKKRKFHLFHRRPKDKRVKKGKRRIEVYWIDKSATEMTIEIKLNEPR